MKTCFDFGSLLQKIHLTTCLLGIFEELSLQKCFEIGETNFSKVFKGMQVYRGACIVSSEVRLLDAILEIN